ncbi:hypothetical protein BCR32DRAFT_288569 [Anaeromyces robustus]|uniref:Uncharacterized protein n=1 Tax=Anaeromyces robustus TaxID=1754192 RepID=A0A1Y1UHH5_9FUNG|nr:hypothetical protein BCR32DRAFT_288569 [Anaeromyces robustus]|eukprot:ORX37510.1 hypothetical protein BCR32DRAFT_288569 [Anaeromyces robustus]
MHTLNGRYCQDDKTYNSIKNNIKFMGIKQSFKKQIFILTHLKQCQPHKKYQNNINKILKASFSESKKTLKTAEKDKEKET